MSGWLSGICGQLGGSILTLLNSDLTFTPQSVILAGAMQKYLIAPVYSLTDHFVRYIGALVSGRLQFGFCKDFLY